MVSLLPPTPHSLPFNNKPQEKPDYRSLSLTDSGGSTLIPPEATRGGPDRVQTERQDLGYTPLLGTVGGVLWGSRDRVGQLKPKEGGFGKPLRV